MDIQPTLTVPDLAAKVIGDMAQVVGGRWGETPEQGAARTLAAAETIAAFDPRGVIETMLAGHCVLFHELIVDSVHHAMRDEEDAAWRATRGTIVAMDKAFGNNLASLERRQAGRAEIAPGSGPTDALDEADIADRVQRHRSQAPGYQPFSAGRSASSVQAASDRTSVSAAESASDQMLVPAETAGVVRIAVPVETAVPVQTAVPVWTTVPVQPSGPVHTTVPVETAAGVQVPWSERMPACRGEPADRTTRDTADPMPSVTAITPNAPRAQDRPFHAVRMANDTGEAAAAAAPETPPPYAGNRQARRYAMRHASPAKASAGTAN